MRRDLRCWLGAFLILAAGAADAAGLRVRLVRASNQEGGIDRSLQDVAPALRNNLVFKSYTLAGQAQVSVPPGGAASLGGYAVNCQPQGGGKVRITITRGGKQLLNTVAGVAPGQPVILGGFPGGDGSQMIFVFTAQ